jgi:hypothetical protein
MRYRKVVERWLPLEVLKQDLFLVQDLDGRERGDDLDCQDFEKMEDNVQSRVRREDKDAYTEDGREGKPTTKNRLGSGGAIKIRVIGCLVFGVGLHQCESTSKVRWSRT